MTASKSLTWLHRSAVALAGATLFLIFAGGMVTTTDSGLAVPDWPLSYGRLMPPMVGGIFYEHGHRMVATAVGFFTVLLAVAFALKENRRWVRRAAWAAFGLVVVQGLLGGATVLLRLPPAVSILHATAGQMFLCLLTALAVWTSASWVDETPARAEAAGRTPLHHIGAALVGVSFFQLVAGAVLRHTGWGLTPHIAGAFLVVALGVWGFARVRHDRARPALRRLGGALLAAILLQIGLGVMTYLLLAHARVIISSPLYATLVITFHVATGALILALATAFALAAFRSRPIPTNASSEPPRRRKLADYFELTKPGITITAGVTALAGFLLGSKGDVDFIRLFHTGLGTLMISGGACALNMLIERDIDARMKRTRRRPLPSGRLQPGEVLLAGTLACVAAIVYLAWTVNLLTALVAGVTMAVYLYAYTPLKKITALCVTVGAIAGALPPVIGWTAATGTLGGEALVLFGIMFFWQYPHFLALAWLYKDDYTQAGLHMLPRLTDGGHVTAAATVANSAALLVVSVLPTFMGMAGRFYLCAAIALGAWLLVGSVRFLLDRSTASARRLFFASLAYVPGLVVALALNLAP